MLKLPRLLAALAVLSTLALVSLAAPPAQAGSARSQLAAEVSKALQHSTAKHLDYIVNDAQVGTISAGANRAAAPASNEKIFTMMTILQLLGSKFRYNTTISGTAGITRGVLHGDLVLRGSGDPTLTTANLHDFAHRLHAKGLRRVSGRLIVDDTRYSHQTLAPGWHRNFVPTESGTMDAFTIDHNEWRSGRAFDADPTPDNAGLWRAALKKAHIKVIGRTTIAHAPRTPVTLVSHRSADLAAIIDATMTYSINFDAEMMLREAGAQRSGYGSPATGIAAVHAVAKQLHLPLGVVHDGSGLSYAGRETPATIEHWLTTLRTLPYYLTAYYALPLSCETGTLRHRLCGPNVRGKVRAKTGTLNHASALSGYVTTNAGHQVTFSFLVGGIKNYTKLYARVDSAIALIVRKG